MANVLDDFTTKFKSFGDTLVEGIDRSFTTITEGFDKSFLRPKADIRHNGLGVADENATRLQVTADKEATRQRAELILQNLAGVYYSEASDALEFELRQLEDDIKQEDIDGVVERLTAAVEVVGVKLAKHVTKNQDKLIAGITNVTEVEDDLKAAHVICQGTRSQLKMAADEVQRQISIITCTRRKRACMEVLEVLSKVDRVLNMHHALRRALEEHDYAEAVLLCIDGFQAVASLSAYKVAPELQVTVQRQHFEVQQRLKASLQTECGFFTGDGYSKLLEAYLLQGLPGQSLATMIISCFKDLIKDTATRLVRSMLLAKAAFTDDGDSTHAVERRPSPNNSGGAQLDEGSYEHLCMHLPPDTLQPCLLKLLENLFEILHNYHLIAQWHEAGVQQHTQATAAAAAKAAAQHHSDSGSGGAGKGVLLPAAGSTEHQPSMPSQEQLDQVQEATKAMLEAVNKGLADSRTDVLQLAGEKVQHMIKNIGRCKGADYCQVVGSCMEFIAIGEAFTGTAIPLRQAIRTVIVESVHIHHKSNMDALKLSLALEDWQPLSNNTTGPDSLLQNLNSKPWLLDVPDSVVTESFEAYLQAGNPFQRKPCGPRAVGGQSVIEGPTGQPAMQPAQASNAVTTSRVATKSSLLVLQCLGSYAALMVSIPQQRVAVWAAMAELFDNFLLACFILFSGVSLEALVWQEDLLPHRLRSALLRITTSKGCKYKAQVEELQRAKLEAATALPSNVFIFDLGSGSSASTSSGPSKLDAFTKRLKDTMVDLMNTDLTQPLPASVSNGTVSCPNAITAALHQQVPQAQEQQQRQQRQLQRQSQQQPLPSNANPTNSRQPSPVPPVKQGPSQHIGGHNGRQTGLAERFLALESLNTIAEAFKAAKSTLLNVLGAGMAKDIEGYFARTVDTAQDLTETIYRGGARQLLAGVVDAEHGLSVQISLCDYLIKEPATAYQPWVEAMVKQYRGFSDCLRQFSLAANVQQKLWEAAIKLGCDAMLSGFSRIQHCSLAGRASMSLDLSAVEKALRTLAPASAMASFRAVDNYVKAFYIPWDDLARWSQVHVAEYGRAKILVLVECMAEAHGIRRTVKAALIEKLNAELAEFA